MIDDGDLARGASLGRYLVLELIGKGGMGVVYSAYDPELDRRVAIKVLRRDGSTGEASALQARLAREAKAMARLSHPNVITVHDVGLAGDRLFMAMELIDGQTLRQWLRQAPRAWEEALAVYLQAGRGLAAAHSAGLVHRDFKPDNVLRGKDGVARVTDFGLVRAEEGGGEAPPARLDRLVTQAGALVGTPAYMAPEQRRGHAATARSDQFAFAVALHEALHGVHPFHDPERGTADTEAADATMSGASAEPTRLRPPPATSRVPAWIRRILLRALATDPEERYPSMTELLDALARDPKHRRRRLVAIVAGTLALGVTAGAWALHEQRAAASVCAGAEERMAGVWTPELSMKVRSAFSATGVSYASATYTRAAAALDAYRDDWLRMHRDACRATRVHGEQSEAVLDERMGCLERRRGELQALVELFLRADPQVVEAASIAVTRLAPVRDCADTSALSTRLPAPAQLRGRIAALETRLAGVRATFAAGKYREGVAPARALAAEARALGYPPLSAEAALMVGRFARYVDDAEGAGGALEEALRWAGLGRDDPALIDVLVELILFKGFDQSRREEAWSLAMAAEAVLARLGGDERRRGDVHAAIGQISDYRDRFDDARREYRIALDLYRGAQLGRQSARVLNLMGAVERRDGHPRAALPYYQASLDLMVALDGPEHPNVAAALNNLAIAHLDSGRYDEALERFRRSLAIKLKKVGAESTVAINRFNIGTVLLDQGRLDEAEAELRQALVIREKLVPGTSILADTIMALGDVEAARGRHGEALEAYHRAEAMNVAADGEEALGIAETLARAASSEVALGRGEEALGHAERAVALFAKALGPGNPRAAMAWAALAEALRARGRCDDAVARIAGGLAAIRDRLGPTHPSLVPLLHLWNECDLERGQAGGVLDRAETGLAIVLATHRSPAAMGQLRFDKARALWGRGGDARRLAQELASAARADLAVNAVERSRVERWLAERAP